MKFDPQQTLKLIQGGLLDHRNTWQTYLEGNPGWMSTAVVLTGPLIIAYNVLSALFSRLTGGFYSYGLGMNIFAAMVFGLVMAAIGITLAALVFSYLAGVFGGKRSFDRAFAALSLVAIPSMTAGVIGALLPWFGTLVTLAGGIVSLVFLWQIMPQALEVPNEKRTVHFVVSLIAVLLINVVIGRIVMPHSLTGGINRFGSQSQAIGEPGMASGMFGELGRQGQLVAAAGQDRFDPPADGEVSEDQVSNLIDVLSKARVAQQKYLEKMNKLSKQMQDKKEASVSDLARIYSGVGGGISANNAEMEVVKTGGGNWAEYSWVKQQLQTAILQQGEGSDAIEHNFALYKEHQKTLDDLL